MCDHLCYVVVGPLVLAVFPIHALLYPHRFTLLAPDLLRTDSQENIYLQADGVTSPIAVSISIQDFGKTTVLLQESVTLNEGNQFHTLKAIQVIHLDQNQGALMGLTQRHGCMLDQTFV